jgi:dTDP-4-amino-4,6-dideoxygalactose transaminase
MLDNGVATRRGIMCIHMEHAYADLQQRHPLQRSEAARDHAILLPLFPQMTDDEQAHVVDALTRAVLQNRTTLPRRRA